MSDAWRCFIAVPLPDELRRELRLAAEGWRERPDLAGLRWTDPDGWHVTLAFLGRVDADQVPRLRESLERALADRRATSQVTGGLGGFPSAGRARVAWYGVADPDRELRDLARTVRAAVGLPSDDPFRAHVTLARARSGPVDLRAWIAEADPPAGALSTHAAELMRSHLGRGPARYETLARVSLRQVARV